MLAEISANLGLVIPASRSPSCDAGPLPLHGHPRHGRTRDQIPPPHRRGDRSPRSRHRRGGDAPAHQRLAHRLGAARFGSPPRDPRSLLYADSEPHTVESNGPNEEERWDSSRAPRRSPASSMPSASEICRGADVVGGVPHRRERDRRSAAAAAGSGRGAGGAGDGRALASNCVGDFYGGAIYVGPATTASTASTCWRCTWKRRADDLRRDLFGEPKKVADSNLLRRGDAFRGHVERGGVRIIELQAEMNEDTGAWDAEGYNSTSRPSGGVRRRPRGGRDPDPSEVRRRHHRLAGRRRLVCPARHRPRPARRSPGPLGGQSDRRRVRPDRPMRAVATTG